MFGNHGLGGLPEEGAHEKSPKCLGGNLGDFWGDFAKVSECVFVLCGACRHGGRGTVERGAGSLQSMVH